MCGKKQTIFIMSYWIQLSLRSNQRKCPVGFKLPGAFQSLCHSLYFSYQYLRIIVAACIEFGITDIPSSILEACWHSGWKLNNSAPPEWHIDLMRSGIWIYYIVFMSAESIAHPQGNNSIYWGTSI